MVVIMRPGATEKEVEQVIEKLYQLGFDVHRSTGVTKTVLGAIGDTRTVDIRDLKVLPGVEDVVRITEPYKLVSRSFRPENSIIVVNGTEIGGKRVVIIAGPCAVESEGQIFTVAKAVRETGATVLRGGCFKPRTSPYSFQGLGEQGLKLLRRAAEAYGLAVITEVMDPSQIVLVSKYADILQVGARNMQNFNLLRELGKIDKPVMLKRGLAATIEEWLMSAEYIMSGGNHRVILCERGIRTFETLTRNTLDISAIPIVKKLSHLPVIADPSHGTGIRDMVIPMARAAIAAGADGIMVEVHPDPDTALSDGAQSLHLHQFEGLMREIRLIDEAIGRRI